MGGLGRFVTEGGVRRRAAADSNRMASSGVSVWDIAESATAGNRPAPGSSLFASVAVAGWPDGDRLDGSIVSPG